MSPTNDPDRKGLRNMSRDSADVAEYYDEWADQYDDTLAQWHYEAPARAAARLRAMLGPDTVVLDAGCGTGLSGRALAKAGFTAIDGIDVSQRSLDIAGKSGVYRTLRRVDMQKLPLPLEDDGYDGLVCVGVMTYLPDSEGILEEFCRIVRPGGAMVLTQRSDILEERGFPGILGALRERGAVVDPEISGPNPYLPENEEFGSEIQVHYITCRVA